MKKHLVMVGAGHAHLTILKNLEHIVKNGDTVTVISPDNYQYYSGMGPGMLAGRYRPQDVRFDVKKMTVDRGGTFIKSRVVKIKPSQKLLMLSSDQTIPYDVASFNTGSMVALNSKQFMGPNVFSAKPIENLLAARKQILEHRADLPVSVTVVGGGPTGLELAANVRQLIVGHKKTADIHLIAGKKLLGNFPLKARKLALRFLAAKKITVIESAMAESFDSQYVTLSDGRRILSELVLLATGVRPSSIYRDSGLQTDNYDGLLVNDYLQAIDYPNIFGGGDCIGLRSQQLAKVGVYAVRQNPILWHNVMAKMKGGPLAKFVPQKAVMLIFNLGDGTGLFCRKSVVWRGRLAFKLKNTIDTKFMRRFQLSGERKEP
ncbi:MAG: FAD-dependent oxidoreductase [Desulfobacterales bacterium]|nr:FAD-dependent oxidoreductase [Desulfobacterales bacterium]